MGGCHDPKGAFDFRPGRERIRIDVAHWDPLLGWCRGRAHLTTARAACQPARCAGLLPSL
jgi:hypothetical protein